jgi:hypothetical protein
VDVGKTQYNQNYQPIIRKETRKDKEKQQKQKKQHQEKHRDPACIIDEFA